MLFFQWSFYSTKNEVFANCTEKQSPANVVLLAFLCFDGNRSCRNEKKADFAGLEEWDRLPGPWLAENGWLRRYRFCRVGVIPYQKAGSRHALEVVSTMENITGILIHQHGHGD